MSERHLTQIEIDEMWYRVERRLREKGKTLAIFVTADGRHDGGSACGSSGGAPSAPAL